DANNSISGGLTNDNGTVVQIGNNDGNGALPDGNVQIGGALIFNRNNTIAVASAISGAGTLTQSGSGTLNLTAANTYSGNTTVTSGTLALSGAGALASPLTSVRNAILDISGSGGSVSFNALSLTNGAFNLGSISASASSLSHSNSTISLVAVVGNPANITATT